MSEVVHLWHYVSWVCRERASNATRWPRDVPQSLCRLRPPGRQTQVVPHLRYLHHHPVLLRTSSTITSLPEQRRARNKDTLTLFLPFWYEHILELQRQDGSETLAEVL